MIPLIILLVKNRQGADFILMMIDKAIMDTDRVICRNISCFDASERGLLSQNILSQLRNFVEYVAEKIYSNRGDIDPNNYGNKTVALKYVQTHGEFHFLYEFHDLLQKSASHYTIDEGGSERLMLSYYGHLLRIKQYLKDTYSLDVLDNIGEFPLNTDTQLVEYYEKIADKIIRPSKFCVPSSYTDRYYIQKVKPFFISKHVFYEVTFTTANNITSKSNRVIAFTHLDILENYAVKLSIHNDNIQVLGKNMNIQVIDDWQVSIRPCEINNFSKVFGLNLRTTGRSAEYRILMKFLKETKMTLIELVAGSDDYYQSVRTFFEDNARSINFFKVLDSCRNIILENRPGCNIIRYLLYNLNNRIIKSQYSQDACAKLLDLHLNYKCIPFDQMPYNTSLVGHNPKLYDLFECIPSSNREHELLARFIRNKTETEGSLFTPKSDITGFENIDDLICKYNNKLYYKHQHRRIEIYKNHLYIKGYADDSNFVIQKLNELSATGVVQYTSSVDSWLKQSVHSIDSDEKKIALRTMFAASHVAIIYGSAGTGKSTLIGHISDFFSDKEKIYLANTNPAVDNLRRKVKTDNSNYKTIASFLSDRNEKTKCDLLFIDECSTVSNSDMRKILEKADFQLLILVGDIYQIESILFGNWFGIAKEFIPKAAIFELTTPFRSTNDNLKLVWNQVRNLEDGALESLVKNGFVANLDESLFDRAQEDQIILCLNYDGLYGINNINRFLQNSNPNRAFQWGINVYKVDDPVLFIESKRFFPLIYNNMKGKIIKIEVEDKKIWFDIELEISINELDAVDYDFELMEPAGNGNSIIRFSVNKYRSTDEDDDYSDVVVPFQIAYAVSIHKAQGLEYKSVKVVITNESEEKITHNIFYTAITRARENLRVYWSPEVENRILSSMKLRNDNKDVGLLKAKYSEIK